MKTFKLYRDDVYNHFETQDGGKPKFDTSYRFDLLDGCRDFDVTCELPDGWQFVKLDTDFSYLTFGQHVIEMTDLYHSKTHNAPYCHINGKSYFFNVIEID